MFQPVEGHSLDSGSTSSRLIGWLLIYCGVVKGAHGVSLVRETQSRNREKGGGEAEGEAEMEPAGE